MTNKKTIILALPEDVGLSDLIAKNFEYHGFDVIHYRSSQSYKYKSFIERLVNFFRKSFFGDRNYKNRQKYKESLDNLQRDILERNTKIDYALFIRPDIFPLDLIEKIKSYTNKTIGYQWDGLSRFPEVFDRIEVFNEFYVFDSKDILNYPEYKLKLTTNFYFDMDEDSTLLSNQDQKTIYFIGSHLPQRISAINQFIKIANNLDFRINFIIGLEKEKIKNKKLYESGSITFTSKGIKYQENLKNVKECDILIDFVNDIHSGLSFRIFESVFYQKKLITNNTEVISYDIYHEDNIFIWDGENLDSESLKYFLDKPYHILSSEIAKKYSFKTWYSLMLGIDGHH